MSGKSMSINGADGMPRWFVRIRRLVVLRRAKMAGEPLHERFAARELVQSHPLVRLVRLLDVAGPAQDRRDSRIVEQRSLAAERHLAACVRRVAGLAQRGDG